MTRRTQHRLLKRRSRRLSRLATLRDRAKQVQVAREIANSVCIRYRVRSARMRTAKGRVVKVKWVRAGAARVSQEMWPSPQMHSPTCSLRLRHRRFVRPKKLLRFRCANLWLRRGSAAVIAALWRWPSC